VSGEAKWCERKDTVQAVGNEWNTNQARAEKALVVLETGR